MTKKIYTNPSMNVSLFETEDVITTSGGGTSTPTYVNAEDAIKGGAFSFDGVDSKQVQAIFAF